MAPNSTDRYMNKKLAILFVVLLGQLHAQTVNDYFEKIRTNNANLTAFFSQMPKGGDLHHHYSGSVYAETYIKYAVDNGFFLNLRTLEIRETAPDTSKWVSFSKLEKKGRLSVYKQRLLEKWSIKDFQQTEDASDKHFFETFLNFYAVTAKSNSIGLVEIKKRAKIENVSYIETIFESIQSKIGLHELLPYKDSLRKYQEQKNSALTQKTLNKLYSSLKNKHIADSAKKYNAYLTKLHTDLAIDDSTFVMRYQNYVLRNTTDALEFFKNLLVAFESASKSPLIVGVNIVAPENEEASMSEYWLHMQMFSFCHEKYPSVKYSLHAGELALGQVKPEELSWHIQSAVYDGKANRIGHGVDMPYENHCYSLLKYMSEKKIAVEINLFSNEFILKVKGDDHPVMLYKQFNVPIVICSDDAGVLRSNLTNQYVLLASRYKEMKYADIKNFVFNSIEYSFIEEPELKQKMLKDLERKFGAFEAEVLSTNKTN